MPNYYDLLPPIESSWFIMEYEMLKEYTREIIVEDYFTFARSIGRYNYARWCAWWYWPDTWDAVNQKRINCWARSFDCAWMIKAYGVIKWILTRKEVWIYNSQTLWDEWIPIKPSEAKRWDYTKRIWNDGKTHWAIVMSELSWNVIEVFDWLGWKFETRTLKLYCRKDYCNYLGKWKIYFATNPLLELAMKRNIMIEPFIEHIDLWNNNYYDWNNYLDYTILVKWYSYDSIANQVVNYWYDNSSGDMQLQWTFNCENQWYNYLEISKTNDHWFCQLNWNVSTNRPRISDPRWRTDYMWQAKICLEKWLAVKDKNLWACYKYNNFYQKKFIFIK